MLTVRQDKVSHSFGDEKRAHSKGRKSPAESDPGMSSQGWEVKSSTGGR